MAHVCQVRVDMCVVVFESTILQILDSTPTNGAICLHTMSIVHMCLPVQVTLNKDPKLSNLLQQGSSDMHNKACCVGAVFRDLNTMNFVFLRFTAYLLFENLS